MKKSLFALMVMLTMTLSANAFGLKLGVTGGYNLSWTKLNGASVENLLSGGSGAGWYAGPKLDFHLFLGLHLDGAIVYNQRKFSVSQEGKTDINKTYTSLDIPVNVKYRLTLSGVGLYAYTGPHFSFSMNDKKGALESLANNTDPVFKRENLSTTWNFGGGIVLFKKLEIGLGYNVALNKAGESFLNTVGVGVGKDKLPDYRLNTFSLQGSFYF